MGVARNFSSRGAADGPEGVGPSCRVSYPRSSRQGRLVSSKEPSRDHWLTDSHARRGKVSLSIRRARYALSPPPSLLLRSALLSSLLVSLSLAPFVRSRPLSMGAHARSPTIRRDVDHAAPPLPMARLRHDATIATRTLAVRTVALRFTHLNVNPCESALSHHHYHHFSLLYDDHRDALNVSRSKSQSYRR